MAKYPLIYLRYLRRSGRRVHRAGDRSARWRVPMPMHDLAIAALALHGFEHQHQSGRAEEAGFVTLLGGEIAERDREVGLTDARGSEEHDVLGALDEGETRQLHDLLCAARRWRG